MKEKNKVLLIQPKNLQAINNYPPLGLISIGSVLKAADYEVTILPASRYKNYQEIIDEECKHCLFVGITVLTTEVPHAIAVTEFIKDRYPDIPVVWGGWHVTLFPEHTVNSPLVDYTIVGDGDALILKVADSLKKKKPLQEKLLRNENHVDIETLPVPNYNLVMKIEDYINDDLTDKFNEYIDYKIRWLPYQSSRGCPYRCKFCINTVTDNTRYRMKSAQKVVTEMEFIIKKYNINHLKIIDDNFFVSITRVREICEAILIKKLKFTWDVECRVDYFRKNALDDPILSLIRKAGCVQFTLGLESGSQSSLNLMAKDTTVKMNEYAVKQIDKHDIVPRTSFIVEIPGEKKSDILKTQKFINKLRKYKKFTAGMATYRPYPRSELHDILVKQGFIEEPKSLMDWKKQSYVRLYGIYDTKKPWQRHYNLSTNMAFYNSVESGVWLREHQLDNVKDKMLFRIFKWLAKVRNRLLFYHFTFDRDLFTKFRDNYYKKRELKLQKKKK